MNRRELQKLRKKLGQALKKIMTDDLGFEPDEIEDYCRIDIIPSENKIEVGAEVDYEELEMVSERLNPVIEKYDKDAYFEPEAPGITVAYIDMHSDNITAGRQTKDKLNRELELGLGDIILSKSNNKMYKILKPLDGKVQVLNLDTNIISYISNDYLTSDHFYIQDEV